MDIVHDALGSISGHRETQAVLSLLSLLACLVLLPRTGRAQMSARDQAPIEARASGWLTTVTEQIRAAEYHPSRAIQGGWSAPNRSHDLRATWRDQTLVIEPRGDSAAWSLAYRLLAVARDGGPREPVSAMWSEGIHDDQLTWRRDGIDESYVNDRRGLEQRLVLHERPAGDRSAPVIVEGLLAGLAAYPSDDGRSMVLRTARGVSTLRIRDLVVTDARGDELTSCLELSVGRLRVVIDDRDAAYPITVQSLITSPAWTFESDRSNAYLGVSVATAGDVNGDGFSDVIIGAPRYAAGVETGRAYVFHGSASGLSPLPDWTADGPAGSHFGRSVATAGDVDGDGFADVIIGAEQYENGTTDGAAFVFLGSASGLGSPPSWTAIGPNRFSFFGDSVMTAGDVNGDGFSDVIVGDFAYENGETLEGGAFVFHGSADALAPAAAWTAESDQSGGAFGLTAATAGDVNGDGYSDVIIGADMYDNGQSDEGRAYVFHGSPFGLDTTPSWTAESDQSGAHFGVSVATAGDVNGDGFSDVVVGARYYQDGEVDEGGVFVFHGSPSGLDASPAWTADSDQPFAQFGGSVGTAGDVNCDGFSDIIVGAMGFDNGETDEGRAFVFHGSPTGLTAAPAWTAESDQALAAFAGSVATAGDVNGDGYSDVVVGARSYDNGEIDEGRAFVFHGAPSGLVAAPAWSAEADQAYARFGVSVGTAGDVNGDGYSDVIVGADLYQSGDEGSAFVFHGSPTGLLAAPSWSAQGGQDDANFGRSVATAGDVNGDGYSDVVVGAYHHSNGESIEGRAVVFHGSASGLESAPSWTTESNQANALYGTSVGSAGDVNGDGFADVIIGAPSFDGSQPNQGRAYVYYGNERDGLDRIPRQVRADGSVPIDLLGATLAGDFRLRANGRSPFGRDKVRLEWEVKPVATPFDGVDIRASPWFDTGAPGADGSVIPLDEPHAPLGTGPFHWRLRLRSRSPFPWQSHWMSLPYNSITETDLRIGSSAPSCDLVYDDITFPPVAPPRAGPWVFTQSCQGADVLANLLVPSVVDGTDIDVLGGGPGTLRLYQLSCSCTDGVYLTEQTNMVRLNTF